MCFAAMLSSVNILNRKPITKWVIFNYFFLIIPSTIIWLQVLLGRDGGGILPCKEPN